MQFESMLLIAFACVVARSFIKIGHDSLTFDSIHKAVCDGKASETHFADLFANCLDLI